MTVIRGRSPAEISIHALREEGDAYQYYHKPRHLSFLSTPSARRATRADYQRVRNISDFYPRPPRGGRQGAIDLTMVPLQISIHALREEGDNCTHNSALRPSDISIHALREEGDAGLCGISIP